jgi:flagellar biosynthetic protein FliR
MTEQAVFSFILVLSRVSAFIGFFPLFGQRQLPVMVKAGLATALTSFWYATVPANNYYVAEHVPAFAAVLMIAQEVGVGLFLAMMLGFLLVPAKIAGAYVGQEVGLSLAAISDPGSTDQSTLVTIIFEALSVLLFFGLNLHHFLILFLDRSMNELANKISVLNLPTEGLIGMIDDMPEFGLMILAPLGIVMFLLVVALAFLNKAAPTMNLFSVGMSLRSGLGMVCLVLFMPVIIESMVMYFMRTIQQLEQMLGFFE